MTWSRGGGGGGDADENSDDDAADDDNCDENDIDANDDGCKPTTILFYNGNGDCDDDDGDDNGYVTGEVYMLTSHSSLADGTDGKIYLIVDPFR